MADINMENRNKYALITGATSGFGYEFSKLFARDGYNLVLVARSKERLDEVTVEIKNKFGVEVTPFECDLFEKDCAKKVYDKVTEMGININALVNDAGQGEWGRFVDIDLQRMLDIIQLNISSLVSLTWYFLKDMVTRNEGRILQVASEAGKTPMPLLSVYAATKAFLLSFTASLANELKDTDVVVTALLPGASDTDFFHKAHAEDTVAYKEQELQDPADVAKDGYEALMRGEDRVISGGKTKMHVFRSNMMSDAAAASGSRKLMEPSQSNDPKRTSPEHDASRKEREHIESSAGSGSNDL
ncbi:SDR family oxidoreductase [Danxiaibacter flavus]|uniref:SDR family oxidoreductase n=1 Tax=Danxiaibacter flavus TaxID=3049108 RepID=A0ABV3ZJ01_9BACT|nr:SDR family oxidoreductase [Chitinophagaceae bacterium DXS]